MTPEIKRLTELYIVGKLATAIPTHTFVPYTGGSRTAGAAEMEPPFTVVSVNEPTKVMATEGTWICTGIVQVITDSSETTSESHSELARQVYAVLADIPGFVDAEFIFHGIDIGAMTSATDDELMAHADIIAFTAGVSG